MRSRLAVVIRPMMRFDATRDMLSVEPFQLADYVPGREDASGCTAAKLFFAHLDRERDGLLSWLAGPFDAEGSIAFPKRGPSRSRQDSRSLD